MKFPFVGTRISTNVHSNGLKDKVTEHNKNAIHHYQKKIMLLKGEGEVLRHYSRGDDALEISPVAS